MGARGSISFDSGSSYYPPQAENALNKKDENALSKKDIVRNVGLLGRSFVLSFGVSQILGLITVITQIASGIFNIGKIANKSIQISKLKDSISAMNTTSECKKEALDQLKSLMDGTEAEKENTVKELKQNMQRFVGGMLGLFPGLGMIAAGAYLNSTNPETYSGTKIEQAASSLSATLLMGVGSPFTGLIQQEIFPLANGSAEKEGRHYFEKINDLFVNHKINGEIKKDMPFLKFFHQCNMHWENEFTDEEKILLEASCKDPNLLTPELCKKIYEISVQDESFNYIQPVEVQIDVDRGDRKQHQITCHYCKGDVNPDNAKTMILFHGSGMVGPQMSEQAEKYMENGWNVLMVTMGGYPGSDEGVSTNETTSIQDVNAVIRYVESKGVETIGVYGFSLGASLAMNATQLSDKVKVAILDKPFDNGANVAANVVRNNTASESLLPSAMIRGVMSVAFPTNRKVPGVPGAVTDGCNNVKKARAFKGKLIVMGGKYDDCMGEGKTVKGTVDKKNEYSENCSERIMTDRKDDTYHMLVDNGHYPIDENNFNDFLISSLNQAGF